MSFSGKNALLKGVYRALRPLIPRPPIRLFQNYVRFWRDFVAYKRLAGQAPCRMHELEPHLWDWLPTTPISFYFFQDTWAFHKVAERRPSKHVDIGSTALLVGCFSGIVPTISIDVRPLSAQVNGLTCQYGLITELPFATGSIESISALCVIEHIGLGRYGDPLDPEGSKKAAMELSRVLAPGGRLYVSAPLGRSYIAFNAHRSFEKDEFIKLFPGLRLKDCALVNNSGFVNAVSADPQSGMHVGLFEFSKELV